MGLLILRIVITLYVIFAYLTVLPFLVKSTKQVYRQAKKMEQDVPLKVPATAIMLGFFAPLSMPYIIYSINKGIRKK